MCQYHFTYCSRCQHADLDLSRRCRLSLQRSLMHHSRLVHEHTRTSAKAKGIVHLSNGSGDHPTSRSHSSSISSSSAGYLHPLPPSPEPLTISSHPLRHHNTHHISLALASLRPSSCSSASAGTPERDLLHHSTTPSDPCRQITPDINHPQDQTLTGNHRTLDDIACDNTTLDGPILDPSPDVDIQLSPRLHRTDTPHRRASEDLVTPETVLRATSHKVDQDRVVFEVHKSSPSTRQTSSSSQSPHRLCSSPRTTPTHSQFHMANVAQQAGNNNFLQQLADIGSHLSALSRHNLEPFPCLPVAAPVKSPSTSMATARSFPSSLPVPQGRSYADAIKRRPAPPFAQPPSNTLAERQSQSNAGVIAASTTTASAQPVASNVLACSGTSYADAIKRQSDAGHSKTMIKSPARPADAKASNSTKRLATALILNTSVAAANRIAGSAAVQSPNAPHLQANCVDPASVKPGTSTANKSDTPQAYKTFSVARQSPQKTPSPQRRGKLPAEWVGREQTSTPQITQPKEPHTLMTTEQLPKSAVSRTKSFQSPTRTKVPPTVKGFAAPTVASSTKTTTKMTSSPVAAPRLASPTKTPRKSAALSSPNTVHAKPGTTVSCQDFGITQAPTSPTLESPTVGRTYEKSNFSAALRHQGTVDVLTEVPERQRSRDQAMVARSTLEHSTTPCGSLSSFSTGNPGKHSVYVEHFDLLGMPPSACPRLASTAALPVDLKGPGACAVQDAELSTSERNEATDGSTDAKSQSSTSQSSASQSSTSQSSTSQGCGTEQRTVRQPKLARSTPHDAESTVFAPSSLRADAPDFYPIDTARMEADKKTISWLQNTDSQADKAEGMAGGGNPDDLLPFINPNDYIQPQIWAALSPSLRRLILLKRSWPNKPNYDRGPLADATIQSLPPMPTTTYGYGHVDFNVDLDPQGNVVTARRGRRQDSHRFSADRNQWVVASDGDHSGTRARHHHWVGGDGREIAFRGYGPDAERPGGHAGWRSGRSRPSSSSDDLSPWSVESLQQSPVGALLMGMQPTAPTRSSLGQASCGQMEVVQAVEHLGQACRRCQRQPG